MKKRISLMMALMLVVLSIFSFGLKSNVKATGLTDEDIINIELNNIYVPNEVIYDFPLVTVSAYNSSITWNSDNEEIIKIENGWAVVNRPTDNDEEVNLTVTIARGEVSDSKTFPVTVKKGVTETNTYNITYVLDGGVNNQNNPTTYKVGETTVLLPATKGTVEFLGWYLDGKKITSLPKGLSGDIELTAKWGAKEAVELVIKNNVNKTEYNALESFDSTGLVLTVKYNDGTESDVSGNEITFDKTTLQGNDTIVTASYSGLSVEIEIKVNKLNISLEGLEFNGYKGIYDGKEHKVELVGQLPEGIKEVKYTDNVLTNAGALTAKAEFVYDEVNYNNPGSLTAAIEITKATLTVTVGNVTIKPGETPTYSYTIEGFVNNETADVLEGQVEYIETTSDYNTPGTYPVGAKGLKSDNYEINYVQGTLTITEEDYVIEAKDLTKVYNGQNQTFTVVVKQGNTEVEGIEYIIKNLDGSEFEGKTDVGQYKVVISLVNEEAEELEVTFEITKANYELTDVEFKDVTTTFDGNVHKVEVTGLPEWLEVSYDKETTLVNAGSITVTASFNHNNPNYNEVTQTLTATLTINKAKLSSVTFEELEDVYFNGEAQEVTIKGKLGNYELTQDDYDIAYEANTQIGTAKAILTGKGNFEGTATLTFEIKESDLSRVRRVKEALEKSYTELPTVFETVKEEASIKWMSTSTALMINADGTYKEILTEKAQTVVVYAVVQYNNAVEYAKFEFVLSVKDSDTQIEIEGVNKDITINSTLLTDNQLANYTVEGQSVKYGYDINLLLENQEVQPEGKVTVRIPILEEYKDDETLKVYHVAEDGSLEDMNAVAENGYLVFETDSFSHYLVTVEAVETEPSYISIAEAKQSEANEIVTVRGVVTLKTLDTATKLGALIQDTTGAIYLYNIGQEMYDLLVVGQEVEVSATYSLFNGLHELTTVTSVTVVNENAELPAVITMSNEETDQAKRVELKEAEWNGSAFVKDGITYNYYYAKEWLTEKPTLETGAYYNITGWFNWYNQAQISPTEALVKVKDAPVVEEPDEPQVPTDKEGLLATFEFGENGDASHNDGSEKLEYSETSGTYTFEYTGTKVYTGARDALGNSCIKFGTSKVVGSLSFTVPADVKEVRIYIAKYKTNASKLSVNGTEYTLEKNSNDGQYDVITVDTSETKTVTITTIASTYRCMLNTIEYYGDSQSGSTPEQPTHEHTVCPECGKCTAADCNGTDADKCQGHEVEPEHEHTACPICEKCTAEDCDGAEEEKCQGHEPEQPSVQGQYFEKVTTAPTDWTGTYLIVYEDGSIAFNGGLATLDAASNGVNVTINDGKIEYSETLAGYTFVISTMEGGYSVKAANGKYIGHGSDANKLTSSDSELLNTITINEDGSVNIICAGGAYLRYNATSGNDRFRYYKSTTYTSQKAISLYKLTGESSSN